MWMQRWLYFFVALVSQLRRFAGAFFCLKKRQYNKKCFSAKGLAEGEFFFRESFDRGMILW
jgi:hypothetical protein